MAAVAVHAGWLPTLPDLTRFVEVAGKHLSVAVHKHDGKYVAMHHPTKCWGYGPTIDAALSDVALMLANDRDWYCHGEGARLYLHGRMYERRAAIQRAFGEA